MSGIRATRGIVAASLAVIAVSAPAQLLRADRAAKLLAETSKDWGRIVVGRRYALINNVWNKGAATGEAKQRVFLKREDGGDVLGWQWRWSSRRSVVAYPEVVCGDKPWDQPSRMAPEFPFRAGTKRLRADFNVALNASGTYNMAFSMWAVSALPAAPNRVSHEVMVWTANHGATPAGRRRGSLEVGGVAYDCYVRQDHGDASGGSANRWTYVAFVARKPVLEGPLDLGAFLDYLLDQGIMSRRHYITSVEFGNEVTEGTGTVVIRDYRVTVR